MRGVLLVDATAQQSPSTDAPQTGKLFRLKWNRYEAESYLIHPATLRRFVEQTLGPGELTAQAIQGGMEYLEAQMGPPFIRDPLAETALLRGEAVSKTVLPGFLQACGIHGFDKSDYYKVAAVQQPDELPPEVTEKLDAMAQALGL